MPLDYSTPSDELMRELLEVAVKAQGLEEFLGKQNIPLDGFPSEQLKQVCIALTRLPRGTAEGCREPLVYARKRLPAIRREYVSPPSSRTEENWDVPPYVSRGDGLDLLLKDLLASVTTALDQYQVEARTELPDAVEQETAISAFGIESLKDAVRKSRALDTELTKAINASAELTQEGVRGAKTLEQQFVDAETYNQMARTEAQMPTVRPNWYQPLVAQFLKMPERITQTGKLLKDGASWVEGGYEDTRPLRDLVREARRKTFSLAIELMTDAGTALETFGKNLVARRDKKESERSESRSEPFDLKTAKAMVIGGHKLPKAWIPHMKTANFGNTKKLHTLKPLAQLTELEEITLARGQAYDLAPIENLSKLRSLFLYGTDVDDLKPLAALKALQSLALGNTKVIDLRPLSTSESLQTLSLFNTQVTDLSPLSGLSQLRSLNLQNTQVSDLSPLSRLTELRSLYLQQTQATDLSPLRGLIELQSLYLNNTPVTDVAPLTGLRKLEFLDLSETPVRNLLPIARLLRLNYLAFQADQESDLVFLQGLPALQTLKLKGGRLRELSPLATMKKLTSLVLESVRISDLTPLSGLCELQSLDLRDTDVEDLSPLGGAIWTPLARPPQYSGI
ncbi:leucine-rich repeat domain-containing protein [Methylocystis sp.]|uniref:leucine-rich repeat domain-containing protein n=1 Tax=Methylocystis sp. TaxID=1911079 RepID=UPI0027335A84|nr:leucine-rich repeat domain-containing protein [Methylocystis sp.]MDP3552652.1 leucine-rich repeat domain-containing protein [Methylocystis sp.]